MSWSLSPGYCSRGSEEIIEKLVKVLVALRGTEPSNTRAQKMNRCNRVSGQVLAN